MDSDNLSQPFLFNDAIDKLDNKLVDYSVNAHEIADADDIKEVTVSLRDKDSWKLLFWKDLYIIPESF